jgi:hypothetical protein
LTLYETRTRKIRATLVTHGVRYFEFSGDGRRLIWMNDQGLDVISLPDLVKQSSFYLPTKLAFVANSTATILAVWTLNGDVTLIDGTSGKELAGMKTNTGRPRVVFSPDDRMLAVATKSKIGLWSVDKLIKGVAK